LITFDQRIGPQVVIGVIVGTIAANIMSGRSLLTPFLKGSCNASGVVLATWLLERLFGRPLSLVICAELLAFWPSATAGAFHHPRALSRFGARGFCRTWSG
jgi:integral membrane sensor domain MASE1